VRIVVLGSGTSNGVPVIGCDCAVCTSPDPRDRRTRPSILVEAGGTTVLVDTTPEMRLQCVAAGVRSIDAVLYTHEHADHIYGLDDTRVFCARGRTLPVYGAPRTLDAVERAFGYIFAGGPLTGGGRPSIDLRPIHRRCFSIGAISFEVVPIHHGDLEIHAYRVGAFAYVTDVNRIEPVSRDRLRGLDTLILGALRDRPHPTHFTIAEALDVIADLAPRRAYLTHLCHEVGHVAVESRLPPGVRLAYDGLALEVADAPPFP